MKAIIKNQAIFLWIWFLFFLISCTKIAHQPEPISSPETNIEAEVLDRELDCTDRLDNDQDGAIDLLDKDCSPLVAPLIPVQPIIALPEPLLPPHPFYPSRIPGGGGGPRRSETPLCGNNVQDLRPSSLLPCSGLLYGITQEVIGNTLTFNLVLIHETTGAITNVGTVPLASEVATINKIAGIDFDPAGNLILVATAPTSVHRFSIDCSDGSIVFASPLVSSPFLPFSADGVTIDPQGLAFTIINGDLDNDNDNDGDHLVKFGYENMPGLGILPIEPPLSTITFPLGLAATGFPSPNILHSLDATNDCEIGKSPATENCSPLASFVGFPNGFNFGYVEELDQNYRNLITYGIVVDGTTNAYYLASVNLDTNTITHIAELSAQVIGLAVNQSFEECDPSSDMSGTTCTDSCMIIESSCADQVDNDMNGAVDCQDPACASLPLCLKRINLLEEILSARLREE